MSDIFLGYIFMGVLDKSPSVKRKNQQCQPERVNRE